MHPAGVLTALTAFILPLSLRAQVQDKPFLEEERRERMDARLRLEDDPHDQVFVWDVGGWLHTEFVEMDDPPDKEERTLRYVDLRLWGEARIADTYTVYARLQTDYTDFNSGDQFEGQEDNRAHIARVDQAFVEGDWRIDGTRVVARGGRIFLSLGRGLLFNQVAYGGVVDVSAGRFNARAFGAHSIPHDDDIDRSIPENDDSYRAFGALELEYRLHVDHRIYGLGLIERDLNDEDPDIPFQDFQYDANYVGGGARGEILPALAYSAEGVYEFGSGVAAGSTTEEDISAFAFLGRLEYFWEVDTSPSFEVEYMYGSGDPDRGSVTDTAAGNRLGTDDEGFLAFGFVQTGFSLFPRLSNLHLFKAGALFHPLESVEAFESLELGAFGYVYRKDESAAPISDPQSFLNDADVGEEIDLVMRWRPLSDVILAVNYGRFFPGDAYLEDDARDFVSAALTYSF